MVRKKSETRIRIEARTTVLVVARPTPSAPPLRGQAVVAGDDGDEEGEEERLAEAAAEESSRVSEESDVVQVERRGEVELRATR